MKTILNEKQYTFLKGYQQDTKLRHAFNNLAKNVFGIFPESWYQQGYWNDKYILHTLFDDEKAVANVSVNIMNFNVLGVRQRFIQIGTVMTDEDYRNKGLSRWLMEQVLEEWNEECELVYLYANHASLELYPKFGFKPVNEYEHYKAIKKNSKDRSFEKLNMDLQSNKDLLYQYAKKSKTFGKLTMSENADLVMYYCISVLKEHVYYSSSLDIIAVAKFNDNQLHLWDVFGLNKVELDVIIESLARLQTNEVLLGFTPEDCSSYEVRKVSGDDVLFIEKGKTTLFDDDKIMFPLLSHA